VILNALALDKTIKHATGNKCQVPRGAFEEVVKIIWKKYNLETSEIKMKTKLSRTKPDIKLWVKHRGTNSPMAGIEAHLLDAILRCVLICQHVLCAEGLALANSLIDGTVAKVNLMAWKATRLKNGTNEKPLVTSGVGPLNYIMLDHTEL
jgi:hypothetical protein